MSRLDQCQETLEADLVEIGKTLNFVQMSFRVYAQTGNMLPYVAEVGELRELLVHFRNNKLTDVSSIYQAMFVQIWAAFEFFVRGLIISYLEGFCSRRRDFSSLEKYGLIRRNILHTGIAFQQIFENRSNMAIDFYAFARNVATGVRSR
jgi:hypothetical protein